jgi:hypothetical protein
MSVADAAQVNPAGRSSLLETLAEQQESKVEGWHPVPGHANVLIALRSRSMIISGMVGFIEGKRAINGGSPPS